MKARQLLGGAGHVLVGVVQVLGGQPGIGFFWRGTENLTDFAFTSLTVTPL
jgi:hypothetical protein